MFDTRALLVQLRRTRESQCAGAALVAWGFPPASLGGGGASPPPPKFWGYSIEMESAPSQYPGSAFAQPPKAPPNIRVQETP